MRHVSTLIPSLRVLISGLIYTLYILYIHYILATAVTLLRIYTYFFHILMNLDPFIRP